MKEQKKMKTKPRSIRIPDDLYDEINDFANNNGLNFNSAVNFLLTNAIKRVKTNTLFGVSDDDKR